ncbi:VOC family protein [Fictibacillus iocasae]|uniref:VOC family protein n=1 Tax=Fictibacillus iocasae TaxID=2715437 RepID=A0ABW2NR76_9BACL
MFFDHMVIFEKGDLKKRLEKLHTNGVPASLGGRHEDWGTENILLYFGLSYIEWLGIEDSQKAERSDNPLVRKLCAAPKGPGHFAIRTTSMNDLRDAFMQEGIHTIHLPGKRRRADGKLLQWELLFVEEEHAFWPFFIQWKESDESRLQDLILNGWTEGEGASPAKIEEIEIAVDDVIQTAERWHRLLSLPLNECNETYAILKLEGGNIRLMKAAPDELEGPIQLKLTTGKVMK